MRNLFEHRRICLSQEGVPDEKEALGRRNSSQNSEIDDEPNNGNHLLDNRHHRASNGQRGRSAGTQRRR